MPKVRRGKSPAVNRNRSSPFPCNSKHAELQKLSLSGSAEEVKEWEEARCPICMEPPHNAVLLKCSSHEKGCRPYMCNTSYRHSNCLDQFCKSYDPHLSTAILQELPLTSTSSHRSGETESELGHPSQYGSELESRLVCPLCRGELRGYMVLEPARGYMNSKPRSCSCETCEFKGTYSELRKHARSEHPSVRPSEVDPARQHDWIMMERERDLEDVLSSIQVSSGEEFSSDSTWMGDLESLMSLFFLEIFYSSWMNRSLADSRHRVPLQDRRSGTLYRVLDDDSQTNQSARWRTNLSSMHTNYTGGQRTPISMHGREANHTARWRTNTSSSRDLHHYYREASPRLGMSSMRMPRSLHQVNQSSSWRNTSGRNPSSQRLRWRNQRWSIYNNQP